MDDWLAAGISYGILLLLAENDAASGFAAALAWGVAAVVFVRNLPALSQKFPGIVPQAGPATPVTGLTQGG